MMSRNRSEKVKRRFLSLGLAAWTLSAVLGGCGVMKGQQEASSASTQEVDSVETLLTIDDPEEKAGNGNGYDQHQDLTACCGASGSLRYLVFCLGLPGCGEAQALSAVQFCILCRRSFCFPGGIRRILNGIFQDLHAGVSAGVFCIFIIRALAVSSLPLCTAAVRA